MQRYVTAAVGIVAMLGGAGVVAVAAIYLGGALLALVYGAWRLARRVRPSALVSPGRARALVRASAALGVLVLLQTALFRLDAVILSQLKGNDAVGLYGVAYRLLESTLFLSYTFVAALLPTLSRLTAGTRTPSVGEAFELGLKLIAMRAAGGRRRASCCSPSRWSTSSTRRPTTRPSRPVRLLGGAAAFYGVSYLAAHVLIAQRRQRRAPVDHARRARPQRRAQPARHPGVLVQGRRGGDVGQRDRARGGLAVVRPAAHRRGGGAADRDRAGRRLRRDRRRRAGGRAPGSLGLVLGALVYPLVLFAVEHRFFPSDVRLLLGVARRPVADVTS